MRVYQGYIILNENVEVDTIRNFVVVQAPPMGDYKAVTVFHDYNLVSFLGTSDCLQISCKSSENVHLK